MELKFRDTSLFRFFGARIQIITELNFRVFTIDRKLLDSLLFSPLDFHRLPFLLLLDNFGVVVAVAVAAVVAVAVDVGVAAAAAAAPPPSPPFAPPFLPPFSLRLPSKSQVTQSAHRDAQHTQGREIQGGCPLTYQIDHPIEWSGAAVRTHMRKRSFIVQ